jgi:hypothetical protein
MDIRNSVDNYVKDKQKKAAALAAQTTAAASLALNVPPIVSTDTCSY